jgi:hypothetical protein
MVGIDDPEPAKEAENILMLQNVPNPFAGTTRISWTSRKAGHTTLRIYDNEGRELETLVNSSMPAGEHSAGFDGSLYSPGVYFYRLQVGDDVLTKKCIIR